MANQATNVKVSGYTIGVMKGVQSILTTKAVAAVGGAAGAITGAVQVAMDVAVEIISKVRANKLNLLNDFKVPLLPFKSSLEEKDLSEIRSLVKPSKNVSNNTPSVNKGASPNQTNSLKVISWLQVNKSKLVMIGLVLIVLFIFYKLFKK